MELKQQFSKELAGDLRQETADKLRAARNLPGSFDDLKGQKNLPENYAGFQSIEESFESLKKDLWGRIFKTEKFRTREAELAEFLQDFKKWDIEKIQREYEERLNKIMESCPLTPEERGKYLSTSAMENMSLEDYLVVLKRLSGEAFYHVTRYGVRENTFMSTGGGHNLGEGQFVDSLSPLLRDGRINSCSATIITNEERAKAMIDLPSLHDFKNQGLSVEQIVDKLMGAYGSDYFLDRESAHFSYGRQLHHMYGAENNYKFYYYYPAEYILHNDFYQKTREMSITVGRGYYHNENGINQQYNDFEIFNFGQGVPTAAGILCITGDARVDPETGSQYLLKDGQVVFNEAGEPQKPEVTISSQEYWEKYFLAHPELKPKKLMYSNFGSWTYGVSEDLMALAKQKDIHSQGSETQEKFKEYVESTRAILRNVFTKIVTEELDEK